MASGEVGTVTKPLTFQLDVAAGLLGVCLATRSHARKHGYRPEARRHVERFLLRAMGVRAEDMAQAEGYSRSNVFRSIQLGGRIARSNARALGLTPADLA